MNNKSNLLLREEQRTIGRLTTFASFIVKAINVRHFVSFCLALGVLVRFLWIMLINAPQVSNYRWYERFALSIANGSGYSVDGIRTAYWPVGYPGFLGIVFSLFGPSAFIAKLCNIGLYAGVILLTYVLSKRLFHSELAARIAVLILSFYPNHIAYTALLSTEILFVFLVLLGAVLFLAAKGRVGMLVLSGLSWGLAVLTKTQAIFLPLIFLAAFMTKGRSLWKWGAIVYTSIVLTVMPWLWRNYAVLGTATLSTNGGIVLFIGNNPYATGTQIWDSRVKSLLGDLGTDNIFDGREVEREAAARTFAMHYLIQHPIRSIGLWPKKLQALYLSDVDGIYYSFGMVNSRWKGMKSLYTGLRIIAEMYYALIIMLLAVSLPTVLGSKYRQDKIGLFIAIYFTLAYLVFFAIARYHFAIMPWMVIYAGLGGDLILNHWKASGGCDAEVGGLRAAYLAEERVG